MFIGSLGGCRVRRELIPPQATAAGILLGMHGLGYLMVEQIATAQHEGTGDASGGVPLPS